MEEEKIDVICEVSNVKHIISKLKEMLPYDEIALEIIPLLDEEKIK